MINTPASVSPAVVLAAGGPAAPRPAPPPPGAPAGGRRRRALLRRPGRLGALANALVLSGLIIPPAVVPTIWLLQKLGLFKTLPGLVLVEIAYGLPYAMLLFRAFIATIPRELDEAAMIDGCGGLR